MRRREFIAGLGGAAVWPLVARAQQPDRMRRIGVLMNVVQEDPGGPGEVMAFRQGLTELGWIEGRNIDIEFRWPGGDTERAQTFAKELVGLRPDVLVGRSTPTTAALKQKTGTIPIIFVNVPEPVEQGFVQSLARPGGNITGFTNFEASIGGKWLQLLKEVDPWIARVAVIYNPQTAPFAGLFLRSVQSAAPTFAVEAVPMPILSDADYRGRIDNVCATATRRIDRDTGQLYGAASRSDHCADGTQSRARPLFKSDFHTKRWLNGLRGRYARHDAARHRLHRPHPQRREPGRPSGAAAGEVPAIDQSQNREGARP
jgi:ABC transporter substrate binding protein